jgi:uncharacterized Zn finger protein
MPGTWTSDRIIALAPDPSSAKAGRDLAHARKWVTLGLNERAVWGECQGSGAKPYQTQIDLSEPAFKCSCPSRKFPCKHGLALFLLTDAQPALFKQNSAPQWVEEWLASRSERAEKKIKKQEAVAAAPPDPAAQAKRAAERVAKVNAGLIEVERWMHDLVRAGFAAAQQQPPAFWETPAARLIDAQARGVARMVREMGSIPASGAGWPDRLLDRFGRLHLLLSAYKRIDTLPPPLAADVRTLIGWPQDKEQLRDQPAVNDQWQVLGQIVEEDDDRIRIQRNWLWGRASDRPALVLNFAHATQSLDTSIVPGTVLDAGVSYFPANYPLRAMVGDRREVRALEEMPGYSSIVEALDAYASALTTLPWLERFPMPLRAVTPLRDGERWMVADPAGDALPLAPRFEKQWELVALSGGGTIALFGEWNGEHLLPLSAAVERKFHALA